MSGPDGASPDERRTSAVPYLSDRWLSEADELVRDLAPIEHDVSVGIEVTDGPGGDRRYRLVLGPDRVGVVGDGFDGVGVRMTMSWSSAVEIAHGRISAQRAFLDGDIRLGGDANLLLGHQRELAALDDRLGDLRHRTDYGVDTSSEEHA